MGIVCVLMNRTYLWGDRRCYVGSWMNGMMSGEGMMTFPDGTTYKGIYLNDKKHGYGILTWRIMHIYIL